MNSMDMFTEDLKEIIQKKVKVIVLQGVYNTAIQDYFKKQNKDVYMVINMEDAVRTAFYASNFDDAILFSPGVISSGTYRTYRERGMKFKEAVAQL
jgi:UDP-N-acetylmuramoylalanine--D-glutamate ligase